jgi:UDP-3-O-[3-hydroxymyristoyl] glucosamine N-acyltransferase
MTSFTTARLAELIGGTASGDADARLDGVCALEDRRTDRISPLLKRRYLRALAPPLPGAVLASAEDARLALELGVASAISHAEPLIGLARIIDAFHPEAPSPGSVHPSAVVDPSARLHPSVRIGPRAVVEADVAIGEGSWIGPGAVICAGSVLGRFVRVGPNAVVGHEGFGFVPADPVPVKIRHIGNAVLEDFVEIGACACVDRGTLGSTVIRTGAKLDNLVQVGHNAEVGRGALIAAQTGLAGSTRIGDGAMIGGQVGVADHRCVGAHARVAGQSGVIGDVRAGEDVAGTPAVSYRRWLRAMVALTRETT